MPDRDTANPNRLASASIPEFVASTSPLTLRRPYCRAASMRRAINSRPSGRGSVREYLITNLSRRA